MAETPGTPDQRETGAGPAAPRYAPPVPPHTQAPDAPIPPVTPPQDQPPFAQQQSQPQQHGQSPYGQPPYGQPAYGQAPYGQPPYGQQPGQPFGYAPQYGTPPYGSPQYGTPQYTAPQYTMSQGFVKPGPGEPFDGAASPNDLTRPLYGASFPQAIARFFKSYASFSGRASRSEYWWVMLACFGLWFVTGTLANILESVSYASSGVSYQAASVINGMLGLVLFVASLGLLVPTLAITWRRLHDANLPGPMFFLTLFPVLGWIAHIVLLTLPPRVEGRRFYRAF